MSDELPLEVEEFLTWLRVERGRSTNTLSAYRGDLRRYLAWLRERGRSLADVDEGDVTDYVGHLRDDGPGPRHREADGRVGAGAPPLPGGRGHGGRGPVGRRRRAPGAPRASPRRSPRTRSTSSSRRWWATTPPRLRDRAILEVLYGTGLRISELVGLSLADVDLVEAVLRAYGKGGKERVVPIGRCAHDALRAWLGPGGRPALEPERWARRGDAEALFLNTRGGRMSRQGAWGIVRKYGEPGGPQGRLTPHVLRHSCATHMLDHGADIRSVQELLGHASISTTQLYTLVSTERLWAVYRAAHPRATVPGQPS